MNKTYEAFDNDYADYIMRTLNLDYSVHYEKFLKYVPKGGHILDFGCGSGRDSFHFKKMGYKITATDAGPEFCRFASNLIKEPVKCMFFQDLNEAEVYDAVWAMASIHHLDKPDLISVLEKIYKSLKPGGVFLFNSRLGEREYTNDRNKHFCEFNQKSFRKFIKENKLICGFKFRDEYINGDLRAGREEQWYTAILIKNKKPIA